jgi:hypothetical protein
MSGGEALVPITMFASGFAMLFGIYYLKTRQNLAMIEKGMNPKEFANRPAPFKSLKTGLFLFGAGLGLFFAYLIDVFTIQSNARFYNSNTTPFLYFSLIGVGGGLGLIISYFIEKKHWLDKEQK